MSMKKNGELKDVNVKTCYTPSIKQYVDLEYNHTPWSMTCISISMFLSLFLLIS